MQAYYIKTKLFIVLL